MGYIVFGKELDEEEVMEMTGLDSLEELDQEDYENLTVEYSQCREPRYYLNYAKMKLESDGDVIYCNQECLCSSKLLVLIRAHPEAQMIAVNDGEE
jgi:hypothetical protein